MAGRDGGYLRPAVDAGLRHRLPSPVAAGYRSGSFRDLRGQRGSRLQLVNLEERRQALGSVNFRSTTLDAASYRSSAWEQNRRAQGLVRLKSLATVREGRLDNPVFEIVGVMADAKNRSVQDAAVPGVYIPSRVTGAYGRSFLIRTSGAAASVIPILRQQVWTVDKSVVIVDIRTLSDALREFSYSEPRFTALSSRRARHRESATYRRDARRPGHRRRLPGCRSAAG